jgi:L-fuconolactonase
MKQHDKGPTIAAFPRRDFLAGLSLAGAALLTGCQTGPRASAEIIDCHTHFYDPTRPEGVPWPGKNETRLYRRVLPRDYLALARPLGITGTVVVEASAWLEDNQWVLDLAQGEPFIKGLVGHLNPGDAAFGAQVKRFARQPLFRGIRVSGREVAQLTEAGKLRNLEVLAGADLALDVNGGIDSLPSVAALARAVPKLRLIIDHVANVRIDGGSPPAEWRAGMEQAAALPNVACKVSGLVEGSGRRGAAPRELNFYRPVLDHVWNCFGEDRLIFGSNWPVCELFADLATVMGIVQAFFAEKGARASRKYFEANARTFYKWVKR